MFYEGQKREVTDAPLLWRGSWEANALTKVITDAESCSLSLAGARAGFDAAGAGTKPWRGVGWSGGVFLLHVEF